MIPTIALAILGIIYLVFLGMSAAVVYHFFRFRVTKTPLIWVIVFLAGSLAFFFAEIIIFSAISWQEFQMNFPFTF